jgi:hypothetical protein
MDILGIFLGVHKAILLSHSVFFLEEWLRMYPRPWELLRMEGT